MVIVKAVVGLPLLGFGALLYGFQGVSNSGFMLSPCPSVMVIAGVALLLGSWRNLREYERRC
jgi:hypothetical protein